MPTRWAKILVSGSNAEVTSITASNITGPIEDSSSLLMVRVGASNRALVTTSSLFFTESAGGQLYFKNLGLAANQLFISGVPDRLTNDSQVVFYEEASTGLQRTSSLRYEASSDTLKFDGTFSGSFTGDGSGLTGVVGTMEYPLVNSDGIGSSSGLSFEYDGTQAVTMSILTSSGGGLAFQNGGLRLTSSLAGNGLYWHGGSGDYSKISVGIQANSGLTTSSNAVAIDPNIAGDGIDFTAGVLSIDLSGSYSGLSLIGSPARLALASTLDGEGLSFSNGTSELNIDNSTVVTSSTTIEFQTASANLTLTADNATATSTGFRGNLIDEPVFTYGISNNLVGDFSILGNLSLTGNTTITGSTTKFSSSLFIQDPFPIFNSGSFNNDGGFMVQTNTVGGAYLFFDHNANRWGVSDENVNAAVTAHSVTGSARGAINTVTVTDDDKATVIASTPIFGAVDSTKAGQITISTNPGTGESPVFIYV